MGLSTDGSGPKINEYQQRKSVMIRSAPNFQSGVHAQRRRSRTATWQPGIAGACIKEFDPFLLDTVNQCLWQRGDHGDEERILLKPKAFAILRYLVNHAGRLVTQEELLNAVWPDTYVQPDVLKRHIVDIRDVLGDDPKSPTYIETRPWLGYQFITAVHNATSAEPAADIQAQARLTGKDQALDDLQSHLGRALGGQRQIVFVAGEPGIGKTTLVNEFQRLAAASQPIRIASGRCVEGDGGGDACHAVLEALGSLCRGPAGGSVPQILTEQAPTWLDRFPLSAKRRMRETRRHEIPGDIGERALHEIGGALETIASTIPLLVVLEDLHWADSSTVDLISTLAHGRRAAKLMVIGTYRPVDARLPGHPLKTIESDLLVHRYVVNSFWSRCGNGNSYVCGRRVQCAR
jgi:DNA-binding winged helix-turn-helix (wHTH) protein